MTHSFKCLVTVDFCNLAIFGLRACIQMCHGMDQKQLMCATTTHFVIKYVVSPLAHITFTECCPFLGTLILKYMGKQKKWQDYKNLLYFVT